MIEGEFDNFRIEKIGYFKCSDGIKYAIIAGPDGYKLVTEYGKSSSTNTNRISATTEENYDRAYRNLLFLEKYATLKEVLPA